MNLVICLLSTSRYVTADQVRASVAGYSDSASDEAFNRMFERDKNELRDLGIPLLTGRNSGAEGAEGYRIDRDAYELAPITLDRDEAAAVTMAAALWDNPTMAAAAGSALMKLRAGGADLSAEAGLDIGMHTATPRSMGSEDVLATLLAAVEARRPVSFGHQPGRTAPISQRQLEPWGVITHRGRWYVIGHDRDRNETRTFRLSRIIQPIKLLPGEITLPEGVDLRATVAAATEFPADAAISTAVVWVARDRVHGLRRIAESSVGCTRNGHDGDDLTLSVASVDAIARMVVGAGSDAVVVSPVELRDRVVATLQSAATGGKVGA